MRLPKLAPLRMEASAPVYVRLRYTFAALPQVPAPVAALAPSDPVRIP
jgi:hypothetical protein